MADHAYYLRMAEVVGDRELRRYYVSKAQEAQQAPIRKDIEGLTRSYLLALRQLGVDLPERVEVEIKAG